MYRPKGYLNAPAPGVSVGRCLLPGLEEVVDYALAVRWDLERPLSQLLMSDSGCAVIFLPDGAQLHGPNRRVKAWTVSGQSWAVTVKFRPGLSRVFGTGLVDGSRPWGAAPSGKVAALIGSPASLPPAGLVACLGRWLEPLEKHVDAECLRVNHICRVTAADRSLNSVADMAERFGMSTRSLHHVLKGSTGLTPRWFIERRRLQDAIRLLQEQPDRSLKELALQLGFTDQAHFGNVCRELTGVTPAKLRGGWKPDDQPAP